MKRYIKSSTTNDYTDYYTLTVDGQKFGVYTKYKDDAYNFQCQISEIHPYDLADYYWCKKDAPVSASVIKNGKRVGIIEVRDWDDDAAEEYHDNDEKFNQDIVKYLCKELRNYNRNIKAIIDRT